jgi:predicted glycoside hydrolase/deacetylase ChbG (UPF0249 family)
MNVPKDNSGATRSGPQASDAMAVFCGDDFGLTKGISEGILFLCEKGLLNATSVMTEAPLLPKFAPRLQAFAGQVKKGLHFNLTQPFTKKPFTRNALMFTPRLSGARRTDVAERLREQLQRFEDIFGCAPDFIDGHEHVHVMTSVRSIFLEEIARRYGTATEKPWIRQVGNAVFATDAKVKALVLNMLNLGFREDCARLGFSTNDNFGGIYSFAPAAPFEKLARAWLDKAQNGTLLMFHPSAKTEDEGDAISQARFREFTVLSELEAGLHLTTALGVL